MDSSTPQPTSKLAAVFKVAVEAYNKYLHDASNLERTQTTHITTSLVRFRKRQFNLHLSNP